jgi:multimeric flavodoxin WrbA
MGKKVLMINGSFRKKNTYGLLVQIGQILKGHDIETEIINLFDYEIKDCTGCDDVCIRQKGCHIKDGVPVIMQKIIDSDGLVLSSPVYLGGATSKFKAFADRTNEWFHKPEPVGKPVLFVATTAVSGIKDVLRYFDQFAVGFGGRKGGSISRTNKNFNLPVKESELAGFLSLLQNDKKYYRPSMNEVVIFEVQKVLAIKSGGEDKKFWEEKNWNGKSYYYDCKMGPGKKLFSKMMFRILSKAIKLPE